MTTELPNKEQYAHFVNRITYHTMIHEQMNRFFSGFRRDAHPMAVMVGTVGALAAFYHDFIDITDPVQRDPPPLRMIAKMPTIAATAFKYSIGQPFMYPRNELDYSSNFLYMMFGVPCEPYKVNPILARGAGPHPSFCTPIMSRTPRPRRCGLPVPQAQTRLPASQRASPVSGDRRMAGRTRPR